MEASSLDTAHEFHVGQAYKPHTQDRKPNAWILVHLQAMTAPKNYHNDIT